MSKRESLAVLVILALIVTSGCSGGDSSSPSSPGNGGSAGGASGVFGTGVIKGKVSFEGEVPAGTAIKMDATPYCTKAHPAGVTRAKFVVDANKGLKWVFVHVKAGVEGTYDKPSDEVVLDQTGCQYDPHVFGIMAGQTLKIKNSDATSHNINSQAKQTGPGAFNISMPRKGMELERHFRKPEVMVRIKCDVHPWMECWAGVVSHPFHSTTGDDGSFNLNRLPAGTYTIEAWHEGAAAPKTQSVTVGDGETKEINFSFKAP